VSKQKILRIVAIAVLAAAGAGAQSDPWAALRFLEGQWEGKANGAPGKGVSLREYRFELNGRFLSARNRSVYDPKSPGDRPEVHECLNAISDRSIDARAIRVPCEPYGWRNRQELWFSSYVQVQFGIWRVGWILRSSY